MALLEERFPADPRVRHFCGWTFVNLGEKEKALAAFRHAAERLEGSYLLAGLAIALWLNGDEAQAIATYRRLVEKTKWLEFEDFAIRRWPDVERQPLEAVRAAAIAKYPGLQTGGRHHYSP